MAHPHVSSEEWFGHRFIPLVQCIPVVRLTVFKAAIDLTSGMTLHSITFANGKRILFHPKLTL